MENSTNITPTVGMPCTICHPNDRYAAKVVTVSATGFKVTVEFTDEGGLKGVQRTFFRNGRGNYSARGCSLKLGVAETYLCPEV